ncbi:MAG: type II toxin-antitoxin system RelE/ParE family toxin [Gammaproteobacteria bacterium]
MRIRWTLRALSQLDDIQDHIAEDNPRAAFDVTAKIFDRVETELPVHPYIGRAGEHVPGTRELVISGTPFIVVYRVSEDDDTVQILRVRHGAQKWPPED